jgi:hypothetical protein
MRARCWPRRRRQHHDVGRQNRIRDLKAELVCIDALADRGRKALGGT